MELGGSWRAIEADEALRRIYHEPSFDDTRWEELAVPGHWQSTPAFASSDGPLLLRRTFELPASPPGRRVWLTFDGVFYQADVWLDGAYVGDAEGYFFGHTFEVTEHARARTEHVLGVEVSCAPQRDRKAKRNITGVFQHWDCIDPASNPGGLWRPVRLHETGSVRIGRLRVLCTEASPTRAVLSLRAVLDAAEGVAVLLRTRVGDLAEHEQEQTIVAGANVVEWRVELDQPPLWWPHALGAQPLLEVVVACHPLPAGDTSDERRLTTGLREVRMRDWITTVNGERLYLKGSNQGPASARLAEVRPDDFERDVVLAKEAGLDLLRVHGHISRPELYTNADRHGLLLWQDFPLQWGYARGIRKQAARQAMEAVDAFGHHPSIALWCAHNEPVATDVEPGGSFDVGREVVRHAAGWTLPTWNRTVLDGSVKRAFEKADPSRPAVAHSGVAGRTDTHLYLGWYYGDWRDLGRLAAAWPRLVRFVSEFGAQAVPEADAFVDPDAWPDLDWPSLAREHALQLRFFERAGLAPERFTTFDAWRRATQAYQADVVRHHVETLRRLKYRPAGGFAHYSFADAQPAISWAVLDHERRPKEAYHALASACAPVIVVADLPPARSVPGQPLALDVHVVNDLRRPLERAVVTATATWPGGRATQAWEGDVPADACVRVGTIALVVPDEAGALTLDLELTAGELRATNRYATTIERP